MADRRLVPSHKFRVALGECSSVPMVTLSAPDGFLLLNPVLRFDPDEKCLVLRFRLECIDHPPQQENTVAKKQIYRVDIDPSFPDEVGETYFVRHTNVRSAQSHVLENRVHSRVASQSDIMELVKEGFEITGLEEEESDTQDLPLE